MKRFTVGVVCLTGWILGPACQAIVGIEDRSEAPAGEPGGVDGEAPDGTSSTGNGDAAVQDAPPEAAPSLGCPKDCLPPAPEGWAGPTALYDGAESGKPASCPTAYPKNDVESHQGVSAAPATCDCGGPVITGRSCTAPVYTYPLACDKFATFNGTASSNTCYTTNNSGDLDYSYKVGTPTLVPGTCTYPNAQTTKPALAYQKVQLACGLTQVTACTGRADCVSTPVPDQPFGHICIYKVGELACPSDDYSTRIVAYQKVDDQRGCTACTATPTGGACGTNWGTRAKVLDCTNANSPTDKAANGCYQYTGTGTIIDIAAMGPTTSGTCTPAGGAPTGVASDIDPITYCCNQ